MIIGKIFHKHFIDKGNFKFLGTKTNKFLGTEAIRARQFWFTYFKDRVGNPHGRVKQQRISNVA